MARGKSAARLCLLLHSRAKLAGMTTRITVILGICIATVVLMFVLGKLADGKSDNKDAELKS